MFFEADLKDKHYKIDITESRKAWTIKLQEGPAGGAGKTETSGDWVKYEISKADFALVENVISFIFGGGSYVLDVIGAGTEYMVYTRGAYRQVNIYNDEAILHESLKRGGSFGPGDNLSAGMPGKIVKVLVKKGDVVKANTPLLIMEAMKMENEMRASHETKIKDVLVQAGDSVESGATLIQFEKP